MACKKFSTLYVFGFFLCSCLRISLSLSGTDKLIGFYPNKSNEVDNLLMKYNALKGQVKNFTSVPIFEFGDEMKEMLRRLEITDVSEVLISELDLQILFSEYLNSLQRHYLMLFMKELEQNVNVNIKGNNKVRDRIMRECRAAMRSAVPTQKIGVWEYEDQLSELRRDLNKLVGDITQIAENESEEAVMDVEVDDSTSVLNTDEMGGTPRRSRGGLFGRSRLSRRISKVWLRRAKWVAAQCLLLGLNFVQNEWHRRTAIRCCERRLAEVPEFPLL